MASKFIIWSQHWVGYKPTRFGTYKTLAEATEAVNRLNASPSGQWFYYSVEEREQKSRPPSPKGPAMEGEKKMSVCPFCQKQTPVSERLALREELAEEIAKMAEGIAADLSPVSLSKAILLRRFAAELRTKYGVKGQGK